MTNRATLEALLARVLEGEGPDRELDAEIEAWLTGRVTHPSAPGFTLEAVGAGRLLCLASRRPAPPYTASLDAVLRHLLPKGWDWVRRTPNTMALVRSNDYRMAEVHPEPCRALIAACLKPRMEAQGE